MFMIINLSEKNWLKTTELFKRKPVIVSWKKLTLV